MDLDTIHSNIKLLLLKHPELRSPFLRKQCHWAYWKEFEGINVGITERQYVNLTSSETLSRAIRKIQEEHPDLRPTKEQEIKRYEMSNSYRRNYSKVEQ